MSKEKLLIVSWTVFPATSGSSVIVDNIAAAFADDELVLFGEAVANTRKGKEDRARSNIHYFDASVELKRGQKYLRWLKLNRLVSDVHELAKRENCTAILGVFPDEFYMYAAYKVSQKMNLPFYTWFHNTYIDNREGLLKLVAKRLQPKFFDAARINFVMSDGMLNFYKKIYPEVSFETLVHGFNIPNTEYHSFQSDTGIKRFVFSGGLNESCRDATVRLIKTIIQNPNYHVHLFTGTTTAVFESYGIAGDNVHHEGFMPLEKFIARLPEFDIMLLPHGFDGKRTEVEYKTIFPTRTIPLLYSNRPILAHSPRGVFLTSFLRDNDCAEIVDEKDENAIYVAIERLLNDERHRERLIKNAIRTASLFDVKNVSKKLKSAIFKNN